MRHLLENTKILVVIVALFDVVMIIFAHISLPAFANIAGSVALFSFIFLVTVYRPSFGLSLFVGVLPFETLNLVTYGGLSLRPYQLIGAALCVAVFWRFVRQKETLQHNRFVVADLLVLILVAMSFAVVQWAIDPAAALRYALIFTSFGILYGVVRCIVTDERRAIRLLPIIITSGCVTSIYAITQNILFLHGGLHQEFMPGRPNAFFAEPDWLGLYLVFVFAMCVVYLYDNAHHKHVWRFFDLSLWSVTVLITVALTITVARSAWVGAVAVVVVYLSLVFGMKKYKIFARHALWLASVAVVSSAIVFYAPITNFELFNRIQSTTTGLQEITVSCTQNEKAAQLVAQKSITHIAELSAYDCRHIDLEEIDAEQAADHTVIKIMRDDPNVAVRTATYAHVMRLVRERPLTGYGWGSSGILLGTDEQGTPLNASNIFLETALSVGIIGMSAFVFLCGWMVLRSCIVIYRTHEERYRALALCGMLGMVAIIVPNFFNAGLFMGFVWFFLGMVAILSKKE